MPFVLKQVRSLTRAEIDEANAQLRAPSPVLTRRGLLLGPMATGLIAGCFAHATSTPAHAAFGSLIQKTVFNGAPKVHQASLPPQQPVAASIPVRNISAIPQRGDIGAQIHSPDLQTFYDSTEVGLDEHQEAILEFVTTTEMSYGFQSFGPYGLVFVTAMQRRSTRFVVYRA